MLNFYSRVVTIVQPTYIWSIRSSILGDKTTSNQLCYGKLAETLAVSKSTVGDHYSYLLVPGFV
jgi:hypothetical protein